MKKLFERWSVRGAREPAPTEEELQRQAMEELAPFVGPASAPTPARPLRRTGAAAAPGARAPATPAASALTVIETSATGDAVGVSVVETAPQAGAAEPREMVMAGAATIGQPTTRRTTMQAGRGRKASAAGPETSAKRAAPAAKAAPARKASARAAPAAKAPAARKATARKATARKATARKATARKSAPRTGAARKSAARKSAARKSAARKSAARPVPVRKPAARAAAGRKAPSRAPASRPQPRTGAPLMPPPPPPPLPARGASDTDRKAAGAMSASLQAVADIGGLAAGHLGRRAREMVRTEAWLPRVEGMARGGGLAGSPTVRALRDLGLLAVSRVQSRLGGLARPDVLAERAREIVVGTLTGTGAGRPMQSRTLQDLGSALSSRLGGSFPLGGLGDRVQIGVILAHLSGPGVLLFKLLQDPRVPARHKILLAAAAGYVVLPGDILPDLVPGLGMVDDVLVIAVALDVMLNHTDDEIVRSHWDGDEVSLAAVRRAVGTAAVLVPARTRRLLLGDSVSTGADLRRFLPRRLARLVPA